jgi:hypothetical protein
LLVISMTWLFLGMVVLQLNLTSARAIALAAGLLLMVASFGSSSTRRRRGPTG